MILTAVAVNCAVKYIPLFAFVSDGFRVIIATVAAAAAGAWVFPSREEEHKEMGALLEKGIRNQEVEEDGDGESSYLCGADGSCDLYSKGASGYDFQKTDSVRPLSVPFLDYTPYAVLGALTFPDVFFSTGHILSAAGGTAVAVYLGYRGKSLVVVALAAILAVYLLELAAGAAVL